MATRRKVRRHVTVLDRTKLGEQDLIVTGLAEQGDQVRAVAKGARKPGSRLAARTELFCDVDMLITEGRSLGIITEAQTRDAHMGIRNDLDRIACASVILEVARLTSYEHVEDPFAYAILRRVLTAVETAPDRSHLDLCTAAYVFKVLSHGGWKPELSSCVACGEEPVTRFSVLAGGALCESCAKDVAGAHPITQHEAQWLSSLIGCTFDVLLESSIDDEMASRLLALSHEWATTHLDARLRAFEFLRGI